MKKRYKLKKWVKVVLTIVALAFVMICLEVGGNRYKRVAEECDRTYGYTCSHYQIEKYVKGGN